jgi:hypothetical protein
LVKSCQSTQIFKNHVVVGCWLVPSYSEGRDQEDVSLKLAQANGFGGPLLKKPTTKKGWEWLKV